jgi:hypothetical protein
MQLVINNSGKIRCVYGEAVDLSTLGCLDIRRASHVEPNDNGQWLADLGPVAGPILGPFGTRSEALAAARAGLGALWRLAGRGCARSIVQQGRAGKLPV